LSTRLPDFLEYTVVMGTIQRWVASAICQLLLGAGLLLGGAWALRHRGRGHALLVVAVGPLLALLVLAGLGLHPFGGLRHCLPITPALLLLFAAGCAWLGRRKPATAQLVGGGVLVLMLASNVLLVPYLFRFDLKQVLVDIRPLVQPGDAVLVAGPQAVRVFRHYHDEDPWLDRVIYLDRPVLTEHVEASEIAAQARAVLGGNCRLWTVAFPPEAERIPPTLKDLAIRQAAFDRVGAQATLWLRRADRAQPEGSE
jgi:hypothetical protein